MIDTATASGNRRSMPSAQEIIKKLNLSQHPEGGWYRETWRAPAPPGERSASTAILFLLSAGERSHWHTVDADEIWIWHSGDPLALHIATDETERPQTLILGGELEQQLVQGVVPARQWQAAEPLKGGHGYALVSCIVAPGFEFSGFALAPVGWQPGQ